MVVFAVLFAFAVVAGMAGVIITCIVCSMRKEKNRNELVISESIHKVVDDNQSDEENGGVV
jgi:hypothetical protein